MADRARGDGGGDDDESEECVSDETPDPAARLGFVNLNDVVGRANEMRDAFAVAQIQRDNLTWPALILVAIHYGRLIGVPESEARITASTITDLIYRGGSESTRAVYVNGAKAES